MMLEKKMKVHKKMNKKIAALISVLIFSFPVFAEKITFSADSMTGSAKKNNSSTVLSGEAYILTESIEIMADRIELSGDDYQHIKASGNVSGKNFDSKMEFTADSLEYDRKSKIATLRGDVKLVDTENSVTAEAQLIEYDSGTDIAVLQIGINLTQKENICSGSYAVYYKKDQVLNISGNAKIKQKDDTFRAQHITLNMETEEITLDGRVKGSVSETEKKSEAEETGESEHTSESEEKSENE